MPNPENGTDSKRILWAMLSGMSAIILVLVGFAVSQVTARIGAIETTTALAWETQQALNRDRESRLTKLESVVSDVIPEIKEQLDRMESKLDAHLGK